MNILTVEDLQHSKEADVESCTVQARKETAKATSNLGAYSFLLLNLVLLVSYYIELTIICSI